MKVYDVGTSCFGVRGVPYFSVRMTMDAMNQLEISLKGGSLQVLQARFFNMPYHEYLKMARDLYDATLIGRTGIYLVMCFQKKEDAERLAKELNRRAAIAIKEHENLQKETKI